MNTKIILKTLALAMLLVPACNKNEIANDENTEKKGFALPVTVNVTREGDDATKATYTDNGDGTGSLGFSTGDKLFVYGMDGGSGKFAGTLTWTSGGTFSGTITTQNAYSGTAQDYLSSAYMVSAYLLPNDYTKYGYLSISGDGYSASIGFNNNNTFASTKALAVEQFSRESAGSYSSGFALSPRYAILNFTITGLTPSTEVTATLTNGSTLAITGLVTTDGSGNATFAMGVADYTDLNSLSLTVGGNDITLVSSSKTLAAGKIYNITRAAAPAPDPLTIEAITAGTIVVKSPQNGMQYSLDGGATKVAMTGYTNTNIPVEAGQKVRFYGKGTTIKQYGYSHETSFGGSGDGFTCKVYGNIMSLVDETGYDTATALSGTYTFWALFSGNTALTDASDLLIPATTLTEACYQAMFRNCSNLTAAPELPATDLVQYCYKSMFENCASLTSVKCLATSGINTNQSTYYWLSGVSATGTFTKAASATWPTSSSGIPSGWTVVNAE